MRKCFLMMIMLTNGCANAQSESIIHGLKYQEQKLQVLVTSNGCTTKDSFQLDWQQQKLTIIRVKEDNCRRMPHKIWLEFDIPKDKSLFRLTNNISQ